jgi:prephenate dehydrogenase
VNSIAIAGVGLMGASFGLALRKAGFSGRIAGVSSPRSLETGQRIGAIDEGVSLEDAARCDLVFLAQPISKILETLPRLAGSSALITDAGSTKRAICQAARGLPNFIGGHPMAGKETRGAESADADLFRGRPWILTAEPPAELRRCIESTGAHILVMTPEEHDRRIALASHLPQVVSNALAKVTASAKTVGGPGLESMTRLSRSSYEIWKDIFATNRDEIALALEEFLREAKKLKQELENGDSSKIGEYFEHK